MLQCIVIEFKCLCDPLVYIFSQLPTIDQIIDLVKDESLDKFGLNGASKYLNQSIVSQRKEFLLGCLKKAGVPEDDKIYFFPLGTGSIKHDSVEPYGANHGE